MAQESGFQVGRDAPVFYEAQVGRFMAPFVDALVAAVVRFGDAVLDVAWRDGVRDQGCGRCRRSGSSG